MTNELMTLQGYEVQLRMYRDQVMGGWLGMGRTLIAAKEAGVVPHGQWETWVESNAGMSVRDAQRLMQLARQIGEDSPLAKLDMTKARMLLRLPAEERETFAAANNADTATSRELQDAIKAKLGAQNELENLREVQRQERRMNQEERSEMIQKANALQEKLNESQMRVRGLEGRLDDMINNPERVEVVPEDYEALKARDAMASRRISEAEDYADEQEKRVRELEDQLADAVNNGGQRRSTADEFIRISGEYVGKIKQMQIAVASMDVSGADLGALQSWCGMIQTEIGTLRNKLRMAPVGGVGRVE